MARTANPKNVKLSTIINPKTNEAYTEEFVAIMEMSGQDQEKWPDICAAMKAIDTRRSQESETKKKNREKRLKDRIEKVAEILKELGVTLPEGATIRSLEVKEKGPMVEVTDADGNVVKDANGKPVKEQDITHYDVDLRYGVKGNTRLMRGSVSTGGKKEPKTDEVIDAEIDALKTALVQDFLKLLA